MTRAPFVMGKAETAFQRSADVYDTTIGWRFVNPLMKKLYGVDSMPETAQNVADEHQISREDQDAFALRSQARAAAAEARGVFEAEIVAVEIKDRKGAVTRRRQGRASARRHDARGARKAARHRASRRQRHRRQRLRRQRRRGCAGACVREGGCGAGPDADRARARLRGRGRRAARDGRRARPGGESLMRAAWPKARRISRRSSSTRPSPRSRLRACAASAFPTTRNTSIRTAAPSRSAIRSACRARAWPERWRSSFAAAAAATASPRCASASGRASPSPSNGCSGPPTASRFGRLGVLSAFESPPPCAPTPFDPPPSGPYEAFARVAANPSPSCRRRRTAPRF